MREVFRSWWMRIAVLAEVLAFFTAAGTVPNWQAPATVAWLLFLTAFLSAGGVVIVTVYFLREYSRRPLNEVQKREIQDILQQYMSKDELNREFVSNSKLTEFVDGFQLYWTLRYRESVIAFAEASRRLQYLPGYIIVAELENSTKQTKRVLFDFVKPPVPSPGVPRGSSGRALPDRNTDFGSLFETEPTTLILYLGINHEIKILKTDPARPTVYYDDGLTAPTLGPSDTESMDSWLERSRRTTSQYKWCWRNKNS